MQVQVISSDLKHLVSVEEGQPYWILDTSTLEPVECVAGDGFSYGDHLKFESEELCKAYIRKIWGS